MASYAGWDKPRSQAIRHQILQQCYCCGELANGAWRSGHMWDCDDCHADPSCQNNDCAKKRAKRRARNAELIAKRRAALVTDDEEEASR